MCKAGFALWIIRRANFIPDHVAHRWHAVIGDYNNFQPITKGEGFNFGWRVAMSSSGQKKRRNNNADFE